MTDRKTRFYLLLVLLSLFALPLFGFLLRGEGLPPQFLKFPVDKSIEPKPGLTFGWGVFGIFMITWITGFLLFPKVVGFKRAIKERVLAMSEGPKEKKFPWWFWPSTVATIIFWFFMWGQYEWLGKLVHYTYVPMWWAFIFALDGWLYKRTGGLSILSRRPKTMLALAFAGWIGWYLYQYINHVLLHNWHYPNRVFESAFMYHLWHHLGNMTAWAPVALWYMIISTFPSLRTIYTNGPKLKFSRRTTAGILIFGLVMSTAFGYDPYFFFWIPWVTTLVVMASALSLLGVWSPFSEIARGNYNPVLMMGFAGVITSVFWEGWNPPSAPANPTFWTYDIPYYQDFLFKLGEMPVLGYWGYYFFGIHVWLFWIVVARVFNFSTDFGDSELMVKVEGEEKSY